MQHVLYCRPHISTGAWSAGVDKWFTCTEWRGPLWKNFCSGTPESLHRVSTEDTWKKHLKHPVYITHPAPLTVLLFFFLPKLCTCPHPFMDWNPFIRKQGRYQSTARGVSCMPKKRLREYSDSVFQVTPLCSALHSSSSFAFTVERVPRRAAHTARPRSGIVLLMHIRLPRSNPSHLSAPAAKCLWIPPAHWPWQINKSQVGLTNLIRAREKQVESPCRGWLKVDIAA